MAFKYNIVRVFEEERKKERAEGKAEGISETVLDLLEDIGVVSEGLKATVWAQKDLDILRKWHKLATRANTIEEFARQISEDVCDHE